MGNPEADTFLALPAVGLVVVRALQAGATIAEAAARRRRPCRPGGGRPRLRGDPGRVRSGGGDRRTDDRAGGHTPQPLLAGRAATRARQTVLLRARLGRLRPGLHRLRRALRRPTAVLAGLRGRLLLPRPGRLPGHDDAGHHAADGGPRAVPLARGPRRRRRRPVRRQPAILLPGAGDRPLPALVGAPAGSATARSWPGWPSIPWSSPPAWACGSCGPAAWRTCPRCSSASSAPWSWCSCSAWAGRRSSSCAPTSTRC